MKHYRFTNTGTNMTDDDRVALINDTTTIENLVSAHGRAINRSHDISRITPCNCPLGESDITVADWRRHWNESDRMFDSMWHGK